MSHAAVKSFDRRGVSCKNARTVQFSGGVVVQSTDCEIERVCKRHNALAQERSTAYLENTIIVRLSVLLLYYQLYFYIT